MSLQHYPIYSNNVLKRLALVQKHVIVLQNELSSVKAKLDKYEQDFVVPFDNEKSQNAQEKKNDDAKKQEAGKIDDQVEADEGKHDKKLEGDEDKHGVKKLDTDKNDGCA